MMDITIDQDQVRRLQKDLTNAAKRLPIELKIAVNDASKKTKREMSRQVREELAATAGEVNKTIKITAKATLTKASAAVTIKETARLAVKVFKPRQIKKGVSYRISKTAGRQLAPGGFMGPRPGAVLIRWKGHAFKRRGKSRLKIDKLHGASPWGVFVKKKLDAPVIVFTAEQLSKSIEERIRLNLLRKNGLI